jgi:hypothetical protein
MPLYTVEIHGRPVLSISAEMIGDIKEDLDAWLGEDLEVVENNGTPLWDGDKANVYVREAWPQEAAVWNAAQKQAIDSDDEEGMEDWVAYLVPVTDPR